MMINRSRASPVLLALWSTVLLGTEEVGVDGGGSPVPQPGRAFVLARRVLTTPLCDACLAKIRPISPAQRFSSLASSWSLSL